MASGGGGEWLGLQRKIGVGMISVVLCQISLKLPQQVGWYLNNVT